MAGIGLIEAFNALSKVDLSGLVSSVDGIVASAKSAGDAAQSAAQGVKELALSYDVAASSAANLSDAQNKATGGSDPMNKSGPVPRGVKDYSYRLPNNNTHNINELIANFVVVLF